jgi:hypothetical protein
VHSVQSGRPPAPAFDPPAWPLMKYNTLRATPRLSHDTLESVLEPLDSIYGGNLVALADLALAPSPLRNTGTGAIPVPLLADPQPTILHLYSHAAVEVHSVDTNGRVVFDTEIDVLGDAEAEVASL